MDSLTTKKNKKKTPAKKARLMVTPRTVANIDRTLIDLEKKFPGIKINRSSFIEWLVLDYFGEFKKNHEKLLIEKFYNEEKFLEAALQEIKKRSAEGENYTYQDFVNKHRPRKVAKKSKPTVRIGDRPAEDNPEKKFEK